MAELTADLVAVPDGPPAGAPLEQKMKSVPLEVDAGGKVRIVVPDYSLPTNSPTVNQVIKATSSTESAWVEDTVSRTVQIDESQTLVNTGHTVNIFEVDCSGGDVNLTLPLVTAVPNQRWVFVKISDDENTLLALPSGANTINGFSFWQAVSQYDTFEIFPNSTLWFVLTLNPHIKAVGASMTAATQEIPSGVPTVIEFDDVSLGESPVGGFNTVTFGWLPKQGGYNFNVGVEILLLDNANFVEICLRYNGVVIGCERKYSTANNQTVQVRLVDSTTNIAQAAGQYDVTVEHDNGTPLDITNNNIFTFFTARRDRF